MLPVQIAVHHLDNGSVAVDIGDDDRNLGQPRERSGFCTTVSGNDLVISRSFQRAYADAGDRPRQPHL